MTDANQTGPVLLVGFSMGVLAALSRFLPDRSLTFVDEPDVLRKRDARAATAGAPALRELIDWEYLREEAADCFYHRYRDLRPAAVVPIIEYGVPFAARLAERYGVPGAGYGAALALRDKTRQRAVTGAAGIPNPRSVPVTGPARLREVMAELAGPVVLKPANRQAAIGTKILRDPAEAEPAWQECLHQDEGIFVPDRPMPLHMLAEELIEGDEFSVELMVSGGRTIFAAPTRKFLFPGARPVEQGHLHPADVDARLTGELIASTERVIDAIGMDTGFVHCEWMVRDGVPYFIECAGRMAGDMIIELVEMAWDYDVVGQFYALMQGQPLVDPVPARAPRFAAVWTSAAPEAGQIEAVEGVAAAEESAGVRTVITEQPGDPAHPLRSSDDRVVMVTASGDTPADALANAQRGTGLIEVKVAPPTTPADLAVVQDP